MKKTYRKIHYIFRWTMTVFLILASFSLIPAVYAEGEEEEPMPDNSIPVVYVYIDESQGTIEDMINSPKHEDYCYGTVSIEVPEGFHYSDFPDLACETMEDLAMNIRGRGNSTWERADKKPFKIKLDKRADIFGLGSNKHWVLIANAMDPSLLRDRITGWLSDRMGFEYSPRGVPVDLVFVGDQYGTHYMGSYYLSENVRVDKNRLEIDELEEEDTELPTISGGYLIQNALQVPDWSKDVFETDRGVHWATHTPSFDTSDDSSIQFGEEDDMDETDPLLFAGADLGDGYDNPAQQEYIQKFIRDFEDILFNGTDEYRELMDVETAAKYWLINAIPLNRDGFVTSSTYIYKKRDMDGATGKLYWGPVWDFDFAWNDNFEVNNFYVDHQWLLPLFCDRTEGGFVEEVKKQWPLMREEMLKLIEDGGVIDQYYAETKNSAEQDRKVNEPQKPDKSYEQEVADLKEWIRLRIEWVDANFDQIDTLAHRIDYTVDGEPYDLIFVASYKYFEHPAAPEKEGYVFTGWADENGTAIDTEEGIGYDRQDLVLHAVYVADEDVTHAQDITFRRNYDIVQNYNPHLTGYYIQYGLIPEDVIDQKVNWSSSNEELMEVDSEGYVTIHGPGTVVFTASLPYGMSRQFTLTVQEGRAPLPESAIPDKEVMNMIVGETDYVTFVTEPYEAAVDLVSYETDNQDVAAVNGYGVITAIGPGTATITIKVLSYDENYDLQEVETYVTVNVSEEPEEIEYTIVSGNDSTYEKGSMESVKITAKRSADDETCFSHFMDVMIDDNVLVKDQDYTAEAGSTVVTLKPEALDKLAEGKHTVLLVFDDGTAEASLTVTAKKEDVPDTDDTDPKDDRSDSQPHRVPDTGDTGHAGWYAVLVGSLLAAAAALHARRHAQ